MAVDDGSRVATLARAVGAELAGGEPRHPSALRSDERLRTKADFTRVFKQGTRVDGAWFVLIGLPNDRSVSRLGLAVGRQVGSAVVRNRAKRVLREAFRCCKPGRPLDVVLVAKPALRGRGALEVASEFRARMARLGGIRGRVSGPRAARRD